MELGRWPFSGPLNTTAIAAVVAPRFQPKKLLGLLLLLLLTALPVRAADTIIISSGNAPFYDNVVSGIEKQLLKLCQGGAKANCNHSAIQRLTVDEISTSSATKTQPYALVITLGRKAAEWASDLDRRTPVFNALIPKQIYEELNNAYQGKKRSAVYLDQPLPRLMRLAKIVNANPIPAVLLGRNTRQLSRPLANAADKAGIRLVQHELQPDEKPGAALNDLLSDANMLLALPDAQVYNRSTIFNILLSTYHRKIPVVGFSASYVKAGALIAAYSSPEDVGKQIADTLLAVKKSRYKVLPKPAFPRYFSIAVNQSVARSLGIDLPSEDKIRAYLAHGGEQ